MYVLISNPIRIHDKLYAGHIVSRHHTMSGMARALDRAQAPTRRSNPGSHLNIQAMVLDEDGLHGVPFDEAQRGE